MIKTAIAVKGKTMSSKVTDTFAKARFLLLADAETGDLLEAAEYTPECGEDRAIYFAEKAVEWECEAILCGPIDRMPFLIIADRGHITRYNAAGLSAEDALAQMQAYRLEYLTSAIDGTGCDPNEEGECHDHGFEDEEE